MHVIMIEVLQDGNGGLNKLLWESKNEFHSSLVVEYG